MPLLDDYHTEEELAAELRKKTGQGTPRQLRSWRAQRIGPPWAKIGRVIVYPKDGFEQWLKGQIQQPVRGHRRAA